MNLFRALFVDRAGERCITEVRHITEEDLPTGEVTIRVAYSGINYKDGLAVTPNGNIVRSYPFIPGIDLSGKVIRSEDTRFREGDSVLVTGYGLGVTHFGGYSEYARVPADWVVPLPAGLTLREAMIIGTAGFTAALSLYRLQAYGLTPEQGPVAVTGATGGVGSMAVAIMASLGYEIAAGTGKPEAAEYLRGLGASHVYSRDEIAGAADKPLQRERWAGAVDPVAGPGLAGLLGAVRYGGAVAVSGLTGGAKVSAAIYPFILRGVSLLGIDSVLCPHPIRMELWRRLAAEWRPRCGYDQLLAAETQLDDVREGLASILRGEIRGRILVKIG